jgi:hypothetical protein
MNRLLAVILAVALACAAHAGGNPDIRIYIDFDPPNYVHEIQPELYTTIQAYVCVDNVGDGVGSVSFRMNDFLAQYPGVFAAPSWMPLVPM